MDGNLAGEAPVDQPVGPPGDPNGEKTALLLEFAQFLHTPPAEDGFDVGPARAN